METKKHIANDIQEYALNENGEPIHINQIDKSHNGLACNCTCPICGESLIARKGNGGKAPHFAHKQDSPCSHPEYIKQTNIHAMAEQIFLEEKEIELPSLSSQAGNYIAYFFQGGKWQIEEVELEKKISDFIPDIILKKGNIILLVEIYVTHAVDENKKNKIIEANLPVIEIDLSEFVHEDITKEELRLHLREITRINWIHLPFAIPKIINFNKTKKTYQISMPNLEIKDCPLSRNVTKETCNNCPFFVGSNDDHVDCLYSFTLSKFWGKIPYPILKPQKDNFNNILITRQDLDYCRILLAQAKQISTLLYQKNYSYQKKKAYINRNKAKKGKNKW
ncbi:MAG: competence protein CoiA family protein [Candidatus Ornithospirochaeta sp.]